MPTDLFEQKLAALDRALPRAGDLLVRDLAGEWAEWVSGLSPRDTNRFANGWALAAEAAQLGKGTLVRPLEASSSARYWAKRLERLEVRAQRDYLEARARLEYWSTLYNRRYQQTGRKGKWEAAARAKVKALGRLLEKREKVLRRAREERAKLSESAIDGGAIIIGGKGEYDPIAGMKISNLSRVITRVYGGSGAVLGVGDTSRVVLHNLEPHASIVESKTGVMKRARSIVRGASGGLLKGSFRSARAVLLDESQLSGT